MSEEVKNFVFDDIEVETVETSSSINELAASANILESDENYQEAKMSLAFLMKYVLSEKARGQDVRVSKKTVEDLIQTIDAMLSAQMDLILHNAQFQEIESVWKGLDFLVQRTEFKENITIDVLNVSKEALLNDFEDNIENPNSGLYHHIYVNEYGQYGGKPYGAIIGAYEFDRSEPDMNLLRRLGSVAAMSHAPFIGNVSSKFFGLDTFENIQQIKDLEAEMENPKYRHWNSLRDSDDARNLGLCMPKFLLREPYSQENPIRAFDYKEVTNNENSNYLWGHASFAFATRLSDSFSQYRWCPNIIGPNSGGTVDDLPVHMFDNHGLEEMYGPAETVLSDRYEFVLSELGFIPLAVKKGTEKACFFSANSIQKPRYFGNDDEAKDKEVNFKLGAQLPYLFVVNRIAHYLKVLQRENLGSWKSRTEIENELNKWLRQYVSDQENPTAAIRSQRPLRSAKITVTEDLDLGAGWYNISMAITPHFKFMGANFSLFLNSKLENE